MDQDLLLLRLLDAGFAQCGAVALAHGDLITSLFVAGLLGSATHCIGMCGPFVLAQTSARLEACPAAEMREFHRLAGAALVPYHLGRATTYAGLGVLAAAVASGIIAVTGLRWLSAVLLLLAALFFLGYALSRWRVTIRWLSSGGGSWWSREIGSRVRPLFDRPVGIRGYVLGVALGFLPCGLLYGALAAAAASGEALAGGLAMIAFAAGTVPALLAVGLAGHVAGRHWQGVIVRATSVLMVVNAGALSYLAWRIIA
ncbi:MAG: sulfite exporter TauE/SafE family protein [Rhodospirillales bacterium]